MRIRRFSFRFICSSPPSYTSYILFLAIGRRWTLVHFCRFRVSTVDKGRSCQHGPPWNTDQNVFWSDGINGANGVRYGKPNDRKPDRWISMAINPAIIPKSPKVAANIIKPKRSSLAELAMLTEGATKLAMAVNATMITMAADTKPACTAA